METEVTDPGYNSLVGAVRWKVLALLRDAVNLNQSNASHIIGTANDGGITTGRQRRINGRFFLDRSAPTRSP